MTQLCGDGLYASFPSVGIAHQLGDSASRGSRDAGCEADLCVIVREKKTQLSEPAVKGLFCPQRVMSAWPIENSRRGCEMNALAEHNGPNLNTTRIYARSEPQQKKEGYSALIQPCCYFIRVIYTDWANHYLAKSGNKRLIKDLQTDVADGVLLAEIIQVVANEKIGDINGCPKSRTQMTSGNWLSVERDAGFGFGASFASSYYTCKGESFPLISRSERRQGASALVTERMFTARLSSGHLRAAAGAEQEVKVAWVEIENIDACLSFLAAKGVNIQGLSSEGKQDFHRKNSQTPTWPQGAHPPLSQQSSAPAQLSHSTHGTAALAAQKAAQAEMQSRLPGPSARVSTAGGDIPTRGSVSAAGNRRSQGFSDKTKANLNKDSSEGMTSQPSVMTEHAPSSAPNSNSKPWRSKSVSSKHISTSSSSISTAASAMQSAKQDKDSSCKADAPPKVVAQKSMLEKLKLFNSKGSSKSSASSSNGAAAQLERSETGSNTDHLEEVDGNVRPGMNGTSNGMAYGAAPSAAPTVSTTASSPKMALRGIAQRTFSRALTAKKSSVKTPDRTELRGDELKEEAAPVTADTDGSNKRTSKITSFIPKGGKVSKKESSTPAHSGIPKPGGKAPGVGGKASSVKEAGERPRSMRLGGGLAMHRGPLDRDSRHSSSTSSLASTEGKACASSGAGGGSTQSTASNTISVQLPQTQQHHSHPNTATVAPFMYRSQTDGLDTEDTESGSGGRGGDVSFTKSSQLSIEDLSGEDPETRRLRTVKNIADLRQNLEETMSSLRGTQVSHSTLETTFDGSVTTDISSSSGGGSAVSNNSGAGSRSILSITSSRPSLSSWRLGQSSPRLQAGDAPSLGNSYGGGRVAGSQGGRYLYPGNLRRQLAGRGGAIHSVELGDRAGEDTDLDSIAVDVTGYMSDGDVLTKNAARTDDVASGYMTDGGLGMYTRRLNRLPDSMAAVRETLHRNTSSGQGDAD
ncbi:hypothetical protein JOQ06_009649, partial [Pogonophryne albipinna]